MASNFDSIVGQYLGTPSIGGPSLLDQKRAEVARAAEAKKYAIDPSVPDQPVSFYDVAAVRQRGSGLSTITNPVQRDLATMDNWSIFGKYGASTGRLFDAYNTGSSAYGMDRQAPATGRGSLDRVKDVGISAAQGLGNGVLGIPALIAGAVSDSAGTWAARNLGDANNWLNSKKSNESQAHQRLYGVENSLDAADNSQQYEVDRSRDGEFVATLKQIGRDTFDAAGNVWNDPEMLRDTVGQATGSLLVGGPLNSGLKKIGSVVLGGAARAGILGEGAALAARGVPVASRGAAVASRIAAFGEKASMPLTIGAMEAGGAYQQTVSDALANLDGRTDLTDEQKTHLANKAGLTAAAIQAPIAAATGLLTSKFEAHPFAPVTVRTAAGNILKEAVEEGTQSGTGQFAQNVGIQQNVDQTRDLDSGVGEQIAQGIIGGMGSAALVETPVVALHSAVAGAKLARTAVGSIGSSLQGRNQRILDQVASESPVSAPRMDAAANAAVQAAPEIHQAATASVQGSTGLNQQEKTQSQDYLDKLFQSVTFHDQEADNQVPVIGDAIRGSSDQFDAMRRVSTIASDEAAAPHERLAAGLYLLDKLRNSQLMIDQVPEAIDKMDDSDPALGQVRDFEDVMLNIQRHPAIHAAIQAAMQFESSIKPDDVSDEKISTPEGQQAAQTAVQLSSLAPDKSNPDVNSQILLHAEQGRVSLTPEQKGYLQAANALHEVEQRHADASQALGLTNSEVISKEIQTDQNDPGTLHKSALSHMDGITAAIEGGNIPLAKRRMQHFLNFAQSMQNKVGALNENLLTGTGGEQSRTAYDAYNPRTGKFFASKPGAYLIGSSRGSVAQAQQTAVDADAVGWLANELTKTYPQLGAEPIDLAKLHAAVSQGPAREVARDYRVAQRDGTLGEFMGLSEQTSPDRTPQAVLDETKADTKVAIKSPKDQTHPSQGQQKSEISSAETTAQDRPQQSESPTSAPQGESPRSNAPSEAEKSIAEAAKKVVEKISPAVEPQVTQEPVQSVAVEEPRPTPSSSIDAAYPDLLGSRSDGKIRNIFKQAFRLPEENPISRLTGTENPVSVIRSALSSASKFRSLIGGNENGGRVTAEVAKAYDGYLGLANAVIKSMDARLAEALGRTKKSGRVADVLVSDERAAGFEENRALAITEHQDTEDQSKLGYNAELQQGAVLAGLQWLLTADQRQRPTDAEAVARILGIPVTSVTQDQLDAFNQGYHLASSVADLGSAITRYWGVQASRTAPEGFVRGVPEGVAKEVMRGMEDAGLLKISEIKENGKTYYQVQSTAGEKLGEQRYARLMEYPSAIEVASIVEPEETSFIGAPPSKVATSQLRNPLVRLTSQQREMIENEQATPFYLNQPMVQFLESIGEDAAVELFGHGDLDEKRMNRNHLQSLESVNLTVRSAARAISSKAAEVASWASANGGVEPDQAPIHYPYEFTSVNRLQMVGKHNPQANKLTREAILPTRSTMDMTQKENLDRFMLGVAQAWGFKVHRMPRADSVARAQELADGKYAKALAAIGDWLQTSGKASRAIDVEEMVDALKEAMGSPASPAAVHAAIEYTRLQQTEDKSKFTTSLYVEADGVTDGPINAMVHTVRGPFTQGWLNVVRKGGLFLGQPGMTMNTSDDKVDLYQHTTNFLKQAMAVTRHGLLDNAPVRSQMDTLFRVLAQLLPEVGFDQGTGDLTFDRGAVKNPLTVTIYGAGAGGIASKITEAVTKAVYERESSKLSFMQDNPKATSDQIAVHLFGSESSSAEEARRKYDQYNEDMSTLLDTRVEKQGGDLVVTDNSSDMPANVSMRSGRENFTMLPGQVENLQKNVLHLFVGPMRQAIAASIGETDQGVSALRRATQVQSIYLQHAFQGAVQDALDRKAKSESGFKKSDFLSQKELQGIYDSLRHLAPFIQTGTQNMMVSGSEKVSFANVGFSRSLAGDLATPAYVYGPVNSGVSGIPLTIIGSGDGQMMQNASTMAGAPEGTLKIYDGMNMKLSTIEEDSRAVNQAVYEAWMRNPLSDVARSYADFVQDAELGAMSDEQRSDLSEALLGQGNKTASRAQIVEMVKGLNDEFQSIAREIQARKNVLSRVQMTVDHMASAEASYDAGPAEQVNLEGLSDGQVTQRLNELYAEELSKLARKAAPSEDIKSDLNINQNIPSSDLPRFVQSLDVPAEQKGLMSDAARVLRKSGWAITTDALPLGSTDGVSDDILGASDFNTRTIHVFSGTSETLLHEMIHATTLDKVHAYYADPSSLSQEDTNAVRRIEGLMSEWLDAAPSDAVNLNEQVRQAVSNAQNAVMGHLGNGENGVASNRANALNEFMAWVLSNQSLARMAQRTKVQNPLLRIVGEALKALRTLIWGDKVGPRVSDDLYSNLRFNTSVLMRSAQPVAASLGDTILFQSGTFGADDRVTRLRQAFFDKVARHIFDQPNPAARLTAQYKSFMAKVQSDAVLASFNAHGFPMDMQQSSTFQMMVSALATEIALNPNSLQRVQELYAHVSKTLTVEDFMRDPEGHDPADRFQAQEKYNSVLGSNLTEIDEQGRSTLMPAFLALAAVDDDFRSVLAKMSLPKGERLANDTIDNVLTNLGSEAMDRLAVIMGGEGRNQPSVRAAIDVLTDRLAEISADQKDYIEQFVAPAGNAIDKANKFVIDQMQSLSQRASDKLEQVKQTSTRKSVKAMANIGQLVAGIFNEDVAGAQAESLMSLANKHLSSKTMHDFLNELVGRTSENASVYDMIKTVRSAIQSMRQQFREHLPELLAKRFDRPVTDDEWSAMYRGLAKSDLAALRSGYSVSQILELAADPVKVANETQAIEQRIRGGHNGALILSKARDLGDYIVHGKAPVNLLRNAHAIERLLGQGVRVPSEVDANRVTDIDHLVSLYALQGLSQADQKSLSSLVQDQNGGMSFMLSYLEGQRRDELAGIQGNEVATYNHFKGYVPSIQEGKAFGHTLVVAEDDQYLDLRQRGFNRVADYGGSGVETGAARKGYYYSAMSGRAAYNQGIIQTVHTTISGVDPVTGFSTSVVTAGRIADPDVVRRLERRLSRASGNQGSEQLLPVFDKDGNVVAYERSLDPLQEQRLGRSTHAANMMGVWRGRQVEELLAQKYNDVLVERLHDMWDNEELVRRDEYVNLYDKRETRADPVLADAIRLIPRETRQKIKDLYGENEFWVRRDMLNDALGYRKASVGDLWTGNTRFSEETQRNIRGLATNVFGVDAYKRMVQAEKIIQNAVTDMRVLIVVKSIVVPMTNLIANVYQLSARGVPLAHTIKGMPAKTAEVDGYVKGRIRQMEIDAEIRAAEGSNDLVRMRKLGVEKQSLEDGWKRLSIWPLIEAGELSSVSDVGIGKEEIDLSEGRLNQYMEGLTSKLPDAVKTLGKYAVVGKDTALFKGLQRTVEYGDFLAKAILYDDLTKRQGLSKEQAMTAVTEEYVNYDRLAGRTRDYLENIGLMWFWNFKIRSTKVALSMIRNNPVHAMLSMLAPAPPFIGSVGNPLVDNILSVGFDGRLGNSIGPGQGLRAHSLLPWVQLIG